MTSHIGVRAALALLPALTATLLLNACGAPSEAQTPPPGPPPVEVAPAVVRPVHNVEEFTGRLESPGNVDLRGRIGGTIERISFRDGASVREGDLLFSIDPRPYEAEVARDEAQLEVARSQAELAKAELARAEKLLAAKAVSLQEYDQLTSTQHTSDASVRAAEAALRAAKLNLEYTSIRAPISGRISRANVTVGNLIDDKTILTSIVTTSKVYAYFDGSEGTFLALRGLPASKMVVKMALANEAGLPHTGHLDFIDNKLNAQTGAIRMRAAFDNSKGEFTPGLFARMQLIGAAAHDSVLTPDRAIGTDQSKKFVFVVGANNVAEFREVQPGPLLDGMRVIESGLHAGDLVVVNGLQRVRPGTPVTPQKLEVDGQGMPIEAPPAAPPGPGKKG